MPQPLAVTAFMASPGRFELPAPRLGGVCSIQLSYGDIFNLLWSRMEQLASQDFDDLIIRRRTLYPAELPGQVRFSVLRRRYRIIVPQFAASVNAGEGFCPEFRLIFWQKKLHRSFFYGIISGRAYERRSHPVPASPRIFDRTAALPHGSDGAPQDSPCQF